MSILHADRYHNSKPLLSGRQKRLDEWIGYTVMIKFPGGMFRGFISFFGGRMVEGVHFLNNWDESSRQNPRATKSFIVAYTLPNQPKEYAYSINS